MNRDVDQYLFEIADPGPSAEPQPAASGDQTGVALPDSLGGILMASADARQLGAQLIRAADLHDAIADAAVDRLELARARQRIGSS